MPRLSYRMSPALGVFLLVWIFPCFTWAAESIPSSIRSELAIQKVRPKLTQELQAHGLKVGAAIFMRIFKESSHLEVWLQKDSTYTLFKTYPICYFSGDLGPKTKQGDGQSPEGFYTVRPNQLNPYSDFHLSFNLGYPNAYDRAHGRTGSALMVHGNCVSIGCYAMTDEKIEEIYALVDWAFRGGQSAFQVHAFPFRMSEKNLARHRNSEWFGFWRTLQKAYDDFDRRHIPGMIKVVKGEYVVGKG
jgi:murein L,D-transpeptidase YafK